MFALQEPNSENDHIEIKMLSIISKILTLSREKNTSGVFLALLTLLSGTLGAEGIHLGQGIMSGEPTESSILLQARLTEGTRVFDEDLPGAEGWVRFEWWPEKSPDETEESPWLQAKPENDFIVRYQATGLTPGGTYHYQAHYGTDREETEKGESGRFRLLPGKDQNESLRIAIVTGMNYYKYHYGDYDRETVPDYVDHMAGYPGIAAISQLTPDYFISTGDTIYYDHPILDAYIRHIRRGKDPYPSPFAGQAATKLPELRRKYHEQFSQTRLIELFRNVAGYWQKDDHDYRVDDADPYIDYPVSHETGIKLYREQLPIVPQGDSETPNWRTHRMTADVQIWLLEGRDHRDANDDPDGMGKSLWGEKQREWLKETLKASDAPFKLVISPTPLIGPDDARKNDNHTNYGGFQYERDHFFRWLKKNEFSEEEVFLITGDRHWQYHTQHPVGFHEFSTGALDSSNARKGRVPGDPQSTDPLAAIRSHYMHDTDSKVTGGFLVVDITPPLGDAPAAIRFQHFDQRGKPEYSSQWNAENPSSPE